MRQDSAEISALRGKASRRLASARPRRVHPPAKPEPAPRREHLRLVLCGV